MYIAYKDLTPKQMANGMLIEVMDIYPISEWLAKQYVQKMINNIIKEITYKLPIIQSNPRTIYWNNVLTELDAI
jgi:hypothetical protein